MVWVPDEKISEVYHPTDVRSTLSLMQIIKSFMAAAGLFS